MVHAGEGHVDEFQMRAGADDLAGQGHVGQHQHVRVPGLFSEAGGVPGAGISGKGVSRGAKLRGVWFQQAVRDAQRLQQNDVHTIIAFLSDSSHSHKEREFLKSHFHSEIMPCRNCITVRYNAYGMILLLKRLLRHTPHPYTYIKQIELFILLYNPVLNSPVKIKLWITNRLNSFYSITM